MYRNLEKFDALGLVKKIQVPGHSARFDGTVTPHPHIKCVVCGRVDDLPETAKLDVTMECKDPCGYKVLEIQAEVLGVCSECRKAGYAGEEKSTK